MPQVYQANNLTYAAQASKKRGEGDGGSGGLEPGFGALMLRGTFIVHHLCSVTSHFSLAQTL